MRAVRTGVKVTLLGLAGGVCLGFVLPTLLNYFISASKKSSIEEAEIAIERTLYDPYTARFGRLKLVQNSLGEFVCGTVNSKNRIGSNIGVRRFAYNIGTGQIMVPPDDKTGFSEAADLLVATRCTAQARR